MKKSMQDEMRELLEHNKRMQQELEKIKAIKQIQRLREQQKQLVQINRAKAQIKIKDEPIKQDKQVIMLRKKLIKKLEDHEKMMKQHQKNIEKQDERLPEQITGDNLMDFLTMVGLSKYYGKFISSNLNTMSQIKNSKKEVFDAIGIPVQDQIKMFKKLRAMGIK